MTTDIQRQLEEAWENAERIAPQEGDTYINKTRDSTYSVGVARWGLDPETCRVLERAEPKAPAWEAVVASNLHDADHARDVFVRTESGNWESPTYSHFLSADELVDPVPLTEVPDRGALIEALEGPFIAHGAWEWPGSVPLANAVLELLQGERRA